MCSEEEKKHHLNAAELFAFRVRGAVNWIRLVGATFFQKHTRIVYSHSQSVQNKRL